MRQCDNVIMPKCNNAENLSASGGCDNKLKVIMEAELVEAELVTKKRK